MLIGILCEVVNTVTTDAWMISGYQNSKTSFLMKLMALHTFYSIPTSIPKQILTPSRFKLILLINNGID